MKSKYFLVLSLILTLILVLISACFNPEAGPPILAGEQRLVVENPVYWITETEDDTTFSFHLDYYVSKDSCFVTGYNLHFDSISVNVLWLLDAEAWQYAGTWYKLQGTQRLSELLKEPQRGYVPIDINAHGSSGSLDCSDTLWRVESDPD